MGPMVAPLVRKTEVERVTGSELTAVAAALPLPDMDVLSR